MNNSKKTKYIKVKEKAIKNIENDSASTEKKPKKKKSKLRGVKKVIAIIGTTIISLFFVVVITGCIVAAALTIYVMEFADNTFDVNLRDVELKFTTFIYAYDADGNEVELARLAREENRVWVDIADMPSHLLDAFVSVEDKRFYDHTGVDWRRTFTAFGSLMLDLTGAGQGGSTITQQLVRGITGDNEVAWDRKLREIFRAISLEDKYTKDDILESYLNRIGLGGMVYGVGAASSWYFDKDVSELTIAESAMLAGLTRSPVAFSPYVDLEKSKERQLYALEWMFKEGTITMAEYNAAQVEQIKFRYPIEGDAYGYIDERSIMPEAGLIEEDEDKAEIINIGAYKWKGDYETTMSWFTDAALEQVINDFAELKGISFDSAEDEIYNGGYKIYLTVDLEKQAILEEKFADPYTMLRAYNESAEPDELLQAAYVMIDYRGNVLAIAGGIGDKPGDRCFNRATQAMRAPGSTIKPISEYSLAFDLNLVNWSSKILDAPIEITDYSAISATNPTGTLLWPDNYEKYYLDTPIFVWTALMESKNTVAVRLAQSLTPKACYDHLTRRLGISTLMESDIDLSPIALGALTNGIKLYELAAAYQVFGNGGVYYDPKMYSKVVGPTGNIVMEPNYYGLQAIAKDTAWVMNRAVSMVVNGGSGTGGLARIDGIEVIGKTGTSNDMKNLLFVGCTPQFVGAYWLGYDNGYEISTAYTAGWRPVAEAWRNISIDLVDMNGNTKFVPDSSVLEIAYCTESGLRATSKCTNSMVGYYRQSFYPEQCNLTHGQVTDN